MRRAQRRAHVEGASRVVPLHRAARCAAAPRTGSRSTSALISASSSSEQAAKFFSPSRSCRLTAARIASSSDSPSCSESDGMPSDPAGSTRRRPRGRRSPGSRSSPGSDEDRRRLGGVGAEVGVVDEPREHLAEDAVEDLDLVARAAAGCVRPSAASSVERRRLGEQDARGANRLLRSGVTGTPAWCSACPNAATTAARSRLPAGHRVLGRRPRVSRRPPRLARARRVGDPAQARRARDVVVLAVLQHRARG